jgi:glucose/arabinose dehydrogenase
VRAIRNAFTLLVSLVLVSAGLFALTTSPARATVPVGFTQAQYVSGLVAPTTMAFAPDGRIFVSEQTGKLRVVKNGVLLAQPFVSLTVDSSGERGLLGIAFDPRFATNHFVYVYYTVPGSPPHNRVSRFTANGDVAVPGSEHPILNLNNLSAASNHNGGGLHFGPGGRLFVSVGDNANGANSQSLSTRLGKILRINPDGTIPTVNPFYNTATGANRAIFAMGLRNPFTFSFRPGVAQFYINDVGQDSWEEIDEGIRGANYGWPVVEGVQNDPRYRDPLYAYAHQGPESTTGCAITGGAFYNPTTVKFPSTYVGDYFFADYCKGWINRYDPQTDTVNTFAATGASPIELLVPGDGDLYYLDRGGRIFRIGYTGSGAPSIGTQPQSQTVSVGHTATFTVSASGAQPLSYQWQRDGVDIPGATAASYSLSNVTMNDNQAGFRVRVSNAISSALSAAAVLTVTSDQPPNPQITKPAAGALYSGGQTIQYAGTATDPEQGALPASAFTWQIDLHHADHIHPAMPPTSGAKSGSFVVPTTGHTESNVFYRVLLTVRDAQGLTTTVFRDVAPRTVSLTFTTSVAGLTLDLDAQPQLAPFTVTAVVGIRRDLEAPSPQAFNGKTHQFVGWSDSQARVHTITTPSVNTTYTATYTT